MTATRALASMATTILVASGLMALTAPPAHAVAGGSQEFLATGAEQTFVVPNGVASITIDAVGAKGGRGWGTAAAGFGAHVVATMGVSQGQTYYVEVGGNGIEGGQAGETNPTFNGGGAGPGGARGGGSGGGATDVRTVSRASGGSAASRLVVAGGGGGGGGAASFYGTLGGAGGSAGANGAKGGGDGYPGGPGAGGVAGASGSDSGGAGGAAGGSSCSSYPQGGGGGGGGGLLGGTGGGGGSGSCGNSAGGGGGGGTSVVQNGAVQVGSTTIDATGTPKVTISWKGTFVKSADPVITGTAEAGTTLTATQGTWDDIPTTTDYVWKADNAVIDGATSETYTPTLADVGKTISVTVTLHKDNYVDATASSAATAAVTRPTCFGQPATIVGSSGNDTLAGTAGPDVIVSGDGNDTISGSKKKDLICGGAGDDTLNGDGGRDQIDGGGGEDSLDGGTRGDHLVGGAGFDTVTYATRTTSVVANLTGGTSKDDGGAEDGVVGDRDLIDADVERLIGGLAGDKLKGNAASNELQGQGGADSLKGADGNDTLYGGKGGDRLKGGAGVDKLYGEGGNDALDAKDGVADEVVDGGGGTDTLVRDSSDPKTNIP